MISAFSPHVYVDNVLEITPGELRKLGVHNMLLDVDGTLKDFKSESFSSQVTNWICELKAAQIALCMLSNGLGRRIQLLATQLDVPFVAKALKPLPFGCYRAMKKIGATTQDTVIIGDQLFADVLAGRLAGIKTILVKPTSLDEPWFTAIKRPLERQFLKWMSPCRGLPAVPEITLHTPKLRNKTDRIAEAIDS